MGKKSKGSKKGKSGKVDTKAKKNKSTKKCAEPKSSKSSKKEKVVDKTFLLAKTNDNFIITSKYGSHYDWLKNEKNLGKETVDSMTLGILRVNDTKKEIVLFMGEDRRRVSRLVLQPNVILNLHNICRDNIGVGNYKIYNGLKIDKETGKEIYMGTIMDFDVRKPVKIKE